MERKRLVLVCVLVVLSFLVFSVPTAGQLTDLISISADAGFDGRFRPDQWMPVKINVENQGSDLTGHIVLRPETSGSGLPNTFSTPVDLPRGSSQSFFLYITARTNASNLRVDLLNEDNIVVASTDVNVLDVSPRDQMYAVVSSAPTSMVNLAPVAVGGYRAFQADWRVGDVPDQVGALDPLTAIIFNDVDTSMLTSDQQEAIREYVMGGGHIIVGGGSNWQPTAAGLRELLPLVPNNSQTIADFGGLAEVAGSYDEPLAGESVHAVGNLIDSAQVMAQTEDGTPLLVRRFLGNGTADYLTLDPNSEPLRSWADLPDLWFTLVTSTNVRPAWAFGFSDWVRATSAVEILPGLDLLPAAFALMVFLGLYIFLIGPLNYVILNRINRLEWAWITIPILIVIFSGLAWSVGFELRGNDVTLSRLSVVQTWPDSEEAQLDQLIGLLAPRRGDYNLGMEDDRMLRPITESRLNANVLSGRLASNTNIRQSSRFEAANFPVDASFIAGFSTKGTTAKPDISGRLVLTSSSGEQPTDILQGSIRNESDILLTSPVLLARGTTYDLGDALKPGDLLTFTNDELTLASVYDASPSSLEYAAGEANPFLSTTGLSFSVQRSRAEATHDTARDILGAENYQTFNFGVSFNDNAETQKNARRQAFLDSFILDQYSPSARGNRVFLVGWAEDTPTTEDLGNIGFEVVDTTLYIIEIEVERDPNQTQDVLISSDQFTWVSLDRQGINDVGPSDLRLFQDSLLQFRFTPLPDAVLSEVEELTIIADRNRSAFSNQAFSIWDWTNEEWVPLELEGEQTITLRDSLRTPERSSIQRFIGPQNAVQLQIVRDDVFGGSLTVQRMGVEQRGTF